MSDLSNIDFEALKKEFDLWLQNVPNYKVLDPIFKQHGVAEEDYEKVYTILSEFAGDDDLKDMIKSFGP